MPVQHNRFHDTLHIGTYHKVSDRNSTHCLLLPTNVAPVIILQIACLYHVKNYDAGHDTSYNVTPNFAIKPLTMISCSFVRGTGITQWWYIALASPTNVARVQIRHRLGWVCWFPTLLWEVFLRVLRFSPFTKNQHLIWFDLICRKQL